MKVPTGGESPRPAFWRLIRCNSGTDSTVWMREENVGKGNIRCLIQYMIPRNFLFRGFLTSWESSSPAGGPQTGRVSFLKCKIIYKRREETWKTHTEKCRSQKKEQYKSQIYDAGRDAVGGGYSSDAV